MHISLLMIHMVTVSTFIWGKYLVFSGQTKQSKNLHYSTD